MLQQTLTAGVFQSSRSISEVSTVADALGEWWLGYLTGRPLNPTRVEATVRSVDLFSGAGGLSLGFGRACQELGLIHQSLAAADIDEGALDVFVENHSPAVTATSSVTSIVDYQVRETRDGPTHSSPSRRFYVRSGKGWSGWWTSFLPDHRARATRI